MNYTFDDIAAFKVGDVAFECIYGANIKFRVMSKPVVTNDGYEGRRQVSFDAVNAVNGDPIMYRLTDGLMHYGPRLYPEPQYVTIRGGEITYDLVGEPKK